MPWVLRHCDDLDHAAIANLLGIAESTARVTAGRALASLRAAEDPTMTKAPIDEPAGLERELRATLEGMADAADRWQRWLLDLRFGGDPAARSRKDRA
jgi:hypothetical protein